jgi:hypothetical protein
MNLSGEKAMNGYLLMLCCGKDDLPVRFFAGRKEALDYALMNTPQVAQIAAQSAARLQRTPPEHLISWAIQPFTNGEPGLAKTVDFDLYDSLYWQQLAVG